MAAAPMFASASEAMVMVHAALGYLATADATAMTAGERARCLRELEQADSVTTAESTRSETPPAPISTPTARARNTAPIETAW